MNEHLTSTELYGGSVAEKYERFFVPTIARPVAADLIEAASPRAGERVLDVGCGTGLLARLAQERVGHSGSVAALDPNPGMLAVARGIDGVGSIDWYEASAESIPLPDASFDLALCQMALQFMSDKPAALREMHRVLVPGGRVALNVPAPLPDAFADLASVLQDKIGAQAAGFTRAVFSMSDPDELRDLFAGAGFKNVRVSSAPIRLDTPAPRDFLWQYVHSTPLAPKVLEAPQDHRDTIEREVTERWQRFAAGGGMTIEVGMTIAVGEK